MNPFLLLAICIPYAPPLPPEAVLPPSAPRTAPASIGAASYLPNPLASVRGPYIVTIAGLQNTLLPPNPVTVIAPLMAYEAGGARIGDRANSMLVYGLPTDLAPKSLVQVTGNVIANRLVMQSYSAYNAFGQTYTEIDGTAPPPTPAPTALTGEALTGSVTWKRVPIVSRAVATYTDSEGVVYTSTTENRSVWALDVDRVVIDFGGTQPWIGDWRERMGQ